MTTGRTDQLNREKDGIMHLPVNAGNDTYALTLFLEAVISSAQRELRAVTSGRPAVVPLDERIIEV